MPGAEEDEQHVKIHVKWDVNIAKYSASDLEFVGKKLSYTLHTGVSGSLSSHELDMFQKTEPQCDLPPQDVSVPTEHPEMHSINRDPPCSLQENECQAYETGVVVEYLSNTHGLWVQGQITSRGFVPEGASTIPSYTVALRSNSQRRDYVQLSHLRIPFEKGRKVNAFDETTGAWLPAFVDGYKKYPFPLAYSVTIEDNAPCNGHSNRDQRQQTLTVPAHNVRPLFEDGDEVDVYLGIALGWVTATVVSSSILTWPQVAVELKSFKEEVVSMKSDAGGLPGVSSSMCGDQRAQSQRRNTSLSFLFMYRRWQGPKPLQGLYWSSGGQAPYKAIRRL